MYCGTDLNTCLKIITMRKAKLFTLHISVIRTLLLILLASGISQNVNAQVDCPPLTVFCQDLHTTFMPDSCMVEVWAKDFINKVNDRETSLDDFIISFEEDSEVMSKIFESVDGNSFEVTIWITSRCDTTLKTRCIVLLDINDNTGFCPTKPCPVDPNPWCGMAIITCSTVQTRPSEKIGHVAAILDTRKNSNAPRGDNWSDPLTEDADVLPIARPEAWRISNIGNIFGIALNPTNGDIFLAASDVYDFDFQQFVTFGPPPPSVTGPAGSAGIYRSNIINPEATNVFVSTTSVYPAPANFNATIIGSNLIPNTGNDPDDTEKSGNGIGNIDYDLRSNHIFASNLEDGKLYSINANTGIITDVYDPFTTYEHSPGLVRDPDRIWGVQVYDCGITSRLYFARNSRVTSVVPDLIEPKEVWSVAINPNGTFASVERIEVIVGKGDMSKLTDLSFSNDCKQMLVAERGNAHSAELNRYVQDDEGAWFFDRPFYVGIVDLNNQGPIYPDGIIGNSSGGGSTFGPTEQECVIDAVCDDLVWGTMNCGDIIADDADPINSVDCAIYGAQGINAMGNDTATSSITDIFISVDTTSDPIDVLRLKSNLGDIEIFNCCCPAEPGRNKLESGIRAMIAGEIYTEEKGRVKETTVSVNIDNAPNKKITNVNGEYLFEDVTMHGSYTIVPEKKGNINDGLSTLDLVLIQRHILNLANLNSPYKIIAADMNNDEKVSATDLVLLRKLILGSLQSNDIESWTFVPASYKFQNPNAPFPYDRTKLLLDLEENAMHEDFIAIKKGDVNGDNFFNLHALSRTSQSATLIIEQRGEFAHVILNQDVYMSGLQFELNSNESFLSENIVPGILTVNESNVAITDKSFKFSWNSITSNTIKKGDILFSFEINGEGERQFSFNLENIAPEFYDNKTQKYNLSIENQKAESFTTLLGNSPNPFSNETIISFDLAENQNVTFDFFNLEGKKIHSVRSDYKSGQNFIALNVSDFGVSSGSIIVYRMTTAGFTDTGKMLIME